ncbi:MAG: hypothetical protein A3H98_03525 [Bacteroidetes bacterium RIFCSPLOWO2_02_FULL_36_8]|nr:MAG: hypothetical protein A3H98_03525 [Bacteroidetes bacterium RIFCSPLOWO2_02_FULL_36_8]OFY69512.1 MAG: hypothetical protein A3G23_10770 [Bacteroidetes bacterium RIFCSPLOWO2_12_FULL_37_12]
MSLAITSAEVIDSCSPYNGKKINFIVQNNNITFIEKAIGKSPSAEFIALAGKCKEKISALGFSVSPGWVDMRVTIPDPGFEYKEDLHSGCQAAINGGFTEIAILPETEPNIQNKDTLAYIHAKTKDELVSVHCIAALTENRKDKTLTEMLDLHHHGAVGFSNGNIPVSNSGILVRALQYSRPFDGLVIVHAEDESLSGMGVVNEGTVSVSLGLKGKPSLSEEIAVSGFIDLLRYAEGRLHISHVSTAQAVSLIRKAKKEGLQITCDVAAHQLSLDESCLVGFDTRFKFNPPLRTQKDIHALIEGIKDETIDAIVSDHCPQDTEAKEVEFEHAANGASTIETAFASAVTALRGKIQIETIIKCFTSAPRKIVRLPEMVIDKNYPANLTFFNQNKKWVVSPAMFKSKSKYSPFEGKELTGAPVFCVNKGKVGRTMHGLN